MASRHANESIIMVDTREQCPLPLQEVAALLGGKPWAISRLGNTAACSAALRECAMLSAAALLRRGCELERPLRAHALAQTTVLRLLLSLCRCVGGL